MGDGRLQQPAGDGQHRQGCRPAQQTLDRTQIEEGAADVAVGRADEPAHLDFIASSQHLGANGVARDGCQRNRKQGGEQPDDGVAYGEQCGQSLGPLAVEVGFCHAGQLAELLRQTDKRSL